MTKKYSLEYDREGCIGAASCAAMHPEQWVISEEDGKADFTKKEFGEEELEENVDAAKSCPVNVIHIIDNETGQRII